MSKEKTIQEIGVRLLRGETMLADSCPAGCNCPLMKSKEAIECVSCGRRFTRDDSDDLVETGQRAAPAPVQKEAEETVVAPRPLPKRVEEGRGSKEPVDNGVGKVGQRLLEGWTMLADHCPVCFNPIVKSPVDGTLWCADCNVQAVTEAQYDKTKHRVFSKAEKEAAPKHERPAVPPPPPPSHHHQPQHQHTFSANQSTAHASCNVSGEEGGSEERAVREELRVTVLERLKKANAELASLKIEHTHEADKLLDHIAKLIATIHGLTTH